MKGRIAIGIGAVLLVVALAIYNRSRQASPARDNSLSSNRMAMPRLPAPRLRATAPPVESSTSDLQSSNTFARFMNGDRPQLTSEQVAAYLEKNRRSAASLLAAFHATGDKAFLREAMEKYSGDPQVDFAAIFKSDSPEERRQWLDTLKRSAPDNALANYLSARDYFKSGQSDQGVQELLAAWGKTKFQDYSLDFHVNAEEAYLAAGYSEVEAKALGSSSVRFPQVSELNQLGHNLVDLANSYRQAGDAESAQAALRIGLNLGQVLDQPGQHTLLYEAVGMAIEIQMLGTMDPNSPYGTAGQTVQDRLNELAQRRTSLNALREQAIPLMSALSDQDLANYINRTKIFGEEAALRWVVIKYGQP